MPSYKSGQTSDGLLPEGDYPFTVEKALLKESKQGNPMIEIWLRLPQGALAIDQLVFVQSCAWTIDQFRISIGEIIVPDEEVDIQPADLLGATGTAHVIVETWEGKKRNKIGSYLEPDDIQLS
jgi:hypothetical protein